MVWKCNWGLRTFLFYQLVFWEKGNGAKKWGEDERAVLKSQVSQVSHYTVPASRKTFAHCPSKQDTDAKVKGVHTCSLTDTGSAVCVCVCALIHLKNKRQNAINSLAQSVFLCFVFFTKRICCVQFCWRKTFYTLSPEAQKVLSKRFTLQGLFFECCVWNFLQTQHR